MSTSGPTVGTGTVVLAAHVTPATSCQDTTQLQVRFRVYAQSNLLGTPVMDQTASVNAQGDAVKPVDSSSIRCRP